MISEASIKNVSFSFFTKKEIENMSVIEIKNPIAFDYLKNPNPEGLYDPLMGVNPFDRLSKCPTCNSQEQKCPGHIGHIKLVFPIYNLFLINTVHKILQAKCYYCHRFTVSDVKRANFKNMIIYLNLGLFEEFYFFEEYNFNQLVSKINKKERKNSRSTNKSEESENNKISDKEELNQLIKELRKKLSLKKKNLKKKFKLKKDLYNTDESSFKKKTRNQLIREFLREAKSNHKCPHCDELKPHIKKDGNTKFSIFFRKNQENTKQDTVISKESKYQLLNPVEIKEHFYQLFQIEEDITDCLFGKFSTSDEIKKINENGFIIKKFNPDYFFLEILPVTPNRFRPESVVNNSTYLHSHTILYTKVLSLNKEIQTLIINNKESLEEENIKKDTENYKKTFSKWIELQETVNCLFDSSQNQKTTEKASGIKQILEKKEGIFRMKIMGKRVNYSARSVISPDPNLNTDEVGIPLFMAKKLTYPENVNIHNIEMLKEAIINGANTHPGALYIIENGQKKHLESATLEQRIGFAKRLLENAENKIVCRHVKNGDIVLFNRQPTLHKPSLMSFKVRVLAKELTIRMHYANCNGFNADFDGDEMNVHVLQNYMARSEGIYLSLSDKQFILPTDKNPIKGFIQDFVFASVFISNKEMFFNKSDYCQLLYCSLMNTIEEDPCFNRIKLLKPAFLYPEPLWTGKQLFSNIIDYIAKYDETGLDRGIKELNMKKGTRINKSYFCKIGQEEAECLIRKNILLKGVVDKNFVGSVSFGLMHSFFELFGSKKTNRLFSAITRLCTTFIKIRGFTCGLKDLLLTPEYDKKRNDLMEKVHIEAIKKQAKFLKIPEEELKFNSEQHFFTPKNSFIKEKDGQEHLKIQKPNLPQNIIQKKLGNFLTESPNALELIDSTVKSSIANYQSTLHKNSTSLGLHMKFPNNNFSSMVITGAKGSVLNHNQVSCNLGQQTLEGKRVPMMASGKTLPCWSPFNPNPRCGGFVGDRFLTGLRSQEFFFHCMAGREGLVDTAVKTSRSGYLQRMLMKNLESLVVEYDYTVRDKGDGSLVEFFYGEDSLDSTKVNVIENLEFLFDNYDTFKDEIEKGEYSKILKKIECYDELEDKKFIMNKYNPGIYLGSISYKAQLNIKNFVEENQNLFSEKKITQKEFENIVYMKYFESMITPGDAVGAIAAQSFGEPSTQMTLNTFHLAGHGGANVTLGIPRLKEILTAKSTKNQIMYVPFKEDVEQNEIDMIMAKIVRVDFLELVKHISFKCCLMLTNNGTILESQERCWVYKIKVIFEDLEAIFKTFDLNQDTFEKLVENKFLAKLMKSLKSFIKKEKNMKKSQNMDNFSISNEKDKEDIKIPQEFKIKGNKLLLLLHIPLTSEQPQILPIIENVMKSINIKKVKNIKKLYLIEDDKKTKVLQTEGINFSIFKKLRNKFKVNQITTNDIHLFTEKYGVK